MLAWHEQGLSIDGEWYPIVLMSFADGMSLGRFVQTHSQDSAVLRELAASWRSLVECMEQEGFAHGDLQTNNVIVSNEGDLTLVDFDASWIDGVDLIEPKDLGHEDFQHPRYLAGDGAWGRHMDTFPAASIFASLSMLAEDPTLDEFIDDDRLLFQRSDYESQASDLWLTLYSSPSTRIKDLAAVMATLCAAPTAPQQGLAEALKKQPSNISVPLTGVSRWYSTEAPNDAHAGAVAEPGGQASAQDWWEGTSPPAAFSPAPLPSKGQTLPNNPSWMSRNRRAMAVALLAVIAAIVLIALGVVP